MITAPKTIHARVSQKLLQKAHLLFNQTTTTSLQEVLQNCRRAKATNVEIKIAPSGDGSKITIIDNGEGIENEDDILHLANSGWDPETQGLESPAGMGFFSLCHLPEGVTVSSQNWRTHINTNTFQGRGGCQLEIIQPMTGTKLEFHLKDTPQNALTIAEGVCHHYPIRTTLNGVATKQVDFLTGAAFIYEFPGGRIGVFPDKISKRENINFYGCTLYNEEIVLRKSNSYEWPYGILVDIHDNTLLDLVLPARNQVAENVKFDDLRTKCREATYVFLSEGKKHKLPFLFYQEAQKMGIDIKEAEAYLPLETPFNLHESYGDWDGPDAPNYTRISHMAHPCRANSILVGALEDSDIAALHISGMEIPLIFSEDPTMEGYSWYPRNEATSLIQHAVLPDGRKFSCPTKDGFVTKEGLQFNNENKTDHPKEITLELTTSGPNKTTIQLPTFIMIDASLDNEQGLEVGWLPKAGKAGEDNISEGLLKALFFNDDSDGGADSYETQTNRFELDAETKLIAVFASPKKAIKYAATQMLNTWEIKTALQKLEAKTITLEIIQGEIHITEIKKQSKGAAKKNSKNA